VGSRLQRSRAREEAPTDIGEDVHQLAVERASGSLVGQHDDLVADCLVPEPGVVNLTGRLPRLPAIGGAGEHGRAARSRIRIQPTLERVRSRELLEDSVLPGEAAPT